MIAKVIIDRSAGEIDKTFDYYIPDNLQLNKGDKVLVPFGNTKISAFCLDITDKSSFETKPIIKILEKNCLNEQTLSMVQYMKDRFFLKYIDVIKLFVPNSVKKGEQELKRLYVKINENISREDMVKAVNKSQQRQIEAIMNFPQTGMFLQDANEKYSLSLIKTLCKKGFLIKEERQVERIPFKDISGINKDVILTDEQEAALKTIFETEKSTILIQGVTGCGKTRIYIEAIKKVIAEGKSAIMLVPEIALTPQMLNNFRGIFKDKVALLHSGLNYGEKYDEWQKLQSGEAKIVVGARSGIFAPLSNIGLIVIDEEHDSSYVSESNPRYRVLNVAIYRAKLNGAKVILGSATPSIETYKKALDGEYELIKIKNRIATNGMPDITIVDMKQEVLMGNNSLLSKTLREQIQEKLDKNEQIMILINRLGFSSLVRCKVCGYVPKCQHCSVSLSYHKEENKLVCHYCGQKYDMINACVNCGSKQLSYGKMGTERVVEEIQKYFKDAKILRLDSDANQKKDGAKKILTKFANNEAQILVGTQMIAKGHDFPNVTLVGLVDADLGLYQQDFRSNEKTFQLVTQMAGRAGRADKIGNVILQTYSPTNYVYRFATKYDFDSFFNKEVNLREITAFPPFTSIIRVLVSHIKKEVARDVARLIYVKLDQMKQINKKVLSLAGMESPINFLKDSYRYQLVLKIKKENELDTISQIYEIINSVDKKRTSIFVEQDPQSLM